ncbi:hypothetical protein RIF29_29141 [Crotalaria pallida]|uniref:Uncharacterized protein n=1 Tax=Crotalaria pallida TaxID=3830 RepID=A0AAN9EDZ6_CROPI
MTELDLYRCVRVGDDGLAALASGCKKLMKLNLSYCNRITDRGMDVGIQAVADGCKRLTDLDLKHCENKLMILVSGPLHFIPKTFGRLGICSYYKNSVICTVFHHVGLVTLAALYYEKVLASSESDYPIPKLPIEVSDSFMENGEYKPDYCNLRREVAYNLHLIYKKCGALDLARQVLKDHCALWVGNCSYFIIAYNH